MPEMQVAEAPPRAIARPTKNFFVRMITRDITLEDCIFDLIDNSVDSAWKQAGSRPTGLETTTDLSCYLISIDFSPEEFRIRDNCGGLTLADAQEHAFTFGRDDDDQGSEYSIGVYGIGMKRAVFKIGTDILISSTFTAESGERAAFAVPINVPEWLRRSDPPWDFEIVGGETLPEDGVSIVVKELTPSTAASFGSPTFLNNLRRTIARDYSIHLGRGLRIQVGGTDVTGWQIELRASEDFKPVRFAYSDKVGEDTVSVELVGGMAAPPPDDPGPDERRDSDRRFGWYVVCNGRIVLAADKTTTTGWGTDDWPSWHNQYTGFIGIVFFSAEDAAALPMTTTKRNVDLSSDVFRRALPRMREVSKAWIAYTNERKQALAEAKDKENAAVPIAIQQVAPRTQVQLPQLTSVRPIEKPANINYSVPVTRLRKLARELGSINMSYRDVGINSFEYTYNDLLGKD